MAKDEGTPGENPPSKRLREFRKLFNDYTNKGGTTRKTSGRRASASPASADTSSPVSTPQKRSVARTPRSKQRTDKSRGNESPSASPSPAATPEKKKDDEPDGAKMAEAKDVAKEDDEEFENAGTSPSNLAQCKIKQRQLQWKPVSEEAKKEDKKDAAKKKAEATEADKQYKSANESADVAIRRRKSRAPSKKQKSSRRKKTNGTNSPSSGASISPAPFNPSAEALDDLPPKELDKGVRCRTKRTGDPYRSASPSAEPLNDVTTDLQDIDQNSKDFKQAIALMEIFKRNNLLENALFPAQNEVVKAFFEGGMRNPDDKILGHISKALDTTLDAIFFRGEDLDCMIEGDLKAFIVDRSKSKPILLDVIISRPEFLPQSWGGRTVALRAAAAEVTVHIQTKREEKK